MIYIPIWLDLLSKDFDVGYADLTNLHSNMVRFIIYAVSQKNAPRGLFTFQYG